MGIKTVAEINKYQSVSINPMEHPNQIYELYSVPSFDNQYPEIIKGSEIGSSKITVEEGDVLVCKINPRINRVWVVEHHTKYPLLASSEWIVVRNGEIESNYLKWYFSSPPFRNMLTSQVAGIGGSLTRAQPKQVAKYPVPIPARSVQQDIVCYLDKISDLISLRKQQLQKLDELVKARFVEMFSSCQHIASMNELCSIITDGTHQPPKFQDNGIPFIFVSNLVNNTVTYNAEKFISEETYGELYKRTPIEIGDLLLSTVGSYGHVAVVVEDKKFLFQRHIAYLKPKHEIVNSFYLHAALLSPDGQRQIEEKVKGIAQKTLNLSEIKTILIPLPSIEEQKNFEVFVKQTDKSKVAVQKALDESQLLFDSLMQKYFG